MRDFYRGSSLARLPGKVCALMILIVAFHSAHSQKNANYVLVHERDTPDDIIRKAATITPSARQLMWQALELTAFFHFGINTFTNREWGNGKEDPAMFNPTALDARQWVKTAKDAGFKLVILTAKHHDGFCLWPSKFTHHSVAASPWKNGKGDVVRAVADACKEFGVRLGIYLSPWDMNSSLYGTDAYNDFFVNQLTELLTNYGPIDEVWFDGANGEGPNGKRQVYDFDRWYKHIRKLQPQAVIAIMGPDVRWVGTETGYGRDTEWSVVPANNLEQDAIAGNSQEHVAFKPQGDMRGADLGSRDKILSATGLVWYPAEVDVSIRPGWFYHPAEDDDVKTPEKLMDIYLNSVGKNAVLLLNIPPDTRGLIHENDVRALQNWKYLRDETFFENHAARAVVEVSSGKKRRRMLVDQDDGTYWTTSGKDTTAVILVKLQRPATFDLMALHENIRVGQRIEKFYIAYWNNGTWIRAAQGTTVGHKRLLQFKPVTTDRVKIVISSSRLNPTLSEIGLYKLADGDGVVNQPSRQ